MAKVFEFSGKYLVAGQGKCKWKIQIFEECTLVYLPGEEWRGNTGHYIVSKHRFVGYSHKIFAGLARRAQRLEQSGMGLSKITAQALDLAASTAIYNQFHGNLQKRKSRP